MKILLIEDDDRTAEFIAKGYKQAEYPVARAKDGEEGLLMARIGSHDLGSPTSCCQNSTG